MRGNHPSQEGAESACEAGLSIDGDTGGGNCEEGFGDEWAWDAWEAGDDDTVAGILEAAASCFAALERLVQLSY